MTPEPYFSIDRREGGIPFFPYTIATKVRACPRAYSLASPASQPPGMRPHHPSPRSPVRSGRAARHLDGRRLQMRLRVTCNPVDPIIVGSPFVDFSWNSKNGISRKTMPTPISLSITRRRRGMTYCWVVDWFDPRSGCRYEAVYSTLAEATRCRSEVLSELSR